MSLHLGIDVGTQSVKALLLDSELGVVADAHSPLATIFGLPHGHSEQHPADWIAATKLAVRAVLGRIEAAKSRVLSLAVSGQQHGFVALDERRQVLRPAKLWNDVSSAPQCAAITKQLGGTAKLFALTGNKLAPGFTGGKVRWMAEREPELFRRLDLVLLPHDYLNLWLTGDATCEPGDASGTGWFDVRKRSVSKPVCDAIAPSLVRKLPRLLAHGEPAGRLSADAASALDLPPGLIVGAGGGDNMMAALGAGAVEPGIVVMSLGTSGTVFACADRPICDEAGEIAAFCSASGDWLPLGCTMNATVSTQWARKLLGLAVHELEAIASATPAGADGVLCLPFFTGERSPDLPHGTGAYLGLTPQNGTPGALARATFEGATFALARLLDRMCALGLQSKELRLTGGGSQSPLWQKIVASACDRPVTVGVSPDAAALGAAISGLWTERKTREPDLTLADVVRDLHLRAKFTTIAPDRAWVRTYRERRMAYETAVFALTPVFEKLQP